MGLLSGVTIKDFDLGKIFSGFGELLIDVRTAITGKAPLDPNKQAELELKLLEMQAKLDEMRQALQIAQIEVNKVEAASPHLFVSGWRPATGWLCVTGLGWQIFIWPLWVWVSKIWTIPIPPDIDVAVLVTLLIGMLGLGTLRTIEKTKDVANK